MQHQQQSLQTIKPMQTSILLVGILMLVIVGFFHTYPPTQTPSTGKPQASFSASRAMSHVWKMAANSHPTGSIENTKVREYLVGQLKLLGFQPEIQSVLIVDPQKQRVGRVHNVLVRIPGTTSGKALLLAAHYDSVHTGPGAADDSAFVAAMLETLRALTTQPALQNDVLCVFTDGEEVGLLGAEAFVKQHPWAKNVGLALNFEYRGNRGAVMMFETSQGNGKLIEGLAKAAPFVLANSLMYEVYKRLPNDTDMTVFKQAGFPGMNFAAIEGLTSYHTQLDRPDLLDQDTLQQEGDIMLALVKQFGNSPLDDLQSSDRVYFDMPGLGLIHYPAGWVIPLSVLLALLFVAVIILGVKKNTVRIAQMVLGTAAFALIVLGLAIGSLYLWLGICRLHPEYQTFSQGDTYNSHWYLLAFVFLSIGLFNLLQAFVCKKLHPIEFAFGVMFCWLILLVVTSVWLPGASFLFFWPLAAMLLAVGAAIALSKKRIGRSNASRTEPLPHGLSLIDVGLTHSYLNIFVVFLASIPGILLFTPLIRELFIGLTANMIRVVITFLVLLLGLLILLLESIVQQKKLIGSTLLMGFVCLVTGSFTSGFDADHPRQNTLFYALDNSNRRAFWLSTDKHLDQWTNTFFPGVIVKQQLPMLFGDRSPDVWSAPAPRLALPEPTIETLSDQVSGDTRKIKLKVKSQRHAPKLKLTIEGAKVLDSKVGGQDYSQTPQTNWYLDGIGLTDEELMVEFTVKTGKAFAVRVIDFTYGLPVIVKNSRPADMMSKPTEYSDTVVLVNTVQFK